MDKVTHVTNADVVWAVVGYDESTVPVRLTLDFFYLTTLERAVEGLTGGVPVTLPEFEKGIFAKLKAKK